MFDNKPNNAVNQESLIDKIKSAPMALKIGLPIGLLAVLLIGAKVLDSSGGDKKAIQANNTKVVSVTAPQPTQPQANPSVTPPSSEQLPSTVAVSSTAPSLQPNAQQTAPNASLATGQPTTDSNLPDPNVSAKKAQMSEVDDLKLQLANAQTKIDELNRLLQQPVQKEVVVKVLRPHYQNKPITRKSNNSVAEVGDRRWDANSSYLVK